MLPNEVLSRATEPSQCYSPRPHIARQHPTLFFVDVLFIYVIIQEEVEYKLSIRPILFFVDVLFIYVIIQEEIDYKLSIHPTSFLGDILFLCVILLRKVEYELSVLLCLLWFYSLGLRIMSPNNFYYWLIWFDIAPTSSLHNWLFWFDITLALFSLVLCDCYSGASFEFVIEI